MHHFLHIVNASPQVYTGDEFTRIMSPDARRFGHPDRTFVRRIRDSQLVYIALIAF